MSPINAKSSSTSLTVDTNRTGTYDLSWQLVDEQNTPVSGGSGSVTAQPLGSDGQTSPVVFTGLNFIDNWTYRVTGTLTTHDPVSGDELYELAGVSVTPPSFYVDRTPPMTDIPLFLHPTKNTGITAIYPRINTVDRPGSVRVRISREDFLIGELRNSAGTVVRRFDTPGWWDGQVWNGTDTDGVPVPRGSYRLFLFDLAGNQGKYVERIFVETRRRELRAWQRTFVARRTVVDTYVGRCSTLRRPSLRGWAGSLGYYANTRCASRTLKDSTVATLHGVYLPPADSYLRIQVSAYGGAARTRPRSTASLRYFNTSDDPRDARTLAATLGRHPGARADSSSSVVNKDRSFFWDVRTRSGARYDIKSYTLLVRYYVLVD